MEWVNLGAKNDCPVGWDGLNPYFIFYFIYFAETRLLVGPRAQRGVVPQLQLPRENLRKQKMGRPD